MTTFAEVRDGAVFVRDGMVYIKVPEIKTTIGQCCACGVDINAVTIGRQDGAPLTDSSGRPVLPWGVHFCPDLEVEIFISSGWEVNAQHWLEKAREALHHH